MEKLESPYVHFGAIGVGFSKDFYTKQEVKALWEKVDEIVDWINEKENEKKHPM